LFYLRKADEWKKSVGVLSQLVGTRVVSQPESDGIPDRELVADDQLRTLQEVDDEVQIHRRPLRRRQDLGVVPRDRAVALARQQVQMQQLRPRVPLERVLDQRTPAVRRHVPGSTDRLKKSVKPPVLVRPLFREFWTAK